MPVSLMACARIACRGISRGRVAIGSAHATAVALPWVAILVAPAWNVMSFILPPVHQHLEKSFGFEEVTPIMERLCQDPHWLVAHADGRLRPRRHVALGR